MEKTCACAELPAVLGTQSLPTSPPVSSFPSVARPHMCAREKQVRSIITLAPRAHFLGSRRRRVRLPTAAHSAAAPARLSQALPVLRPARCLGRALGAGPWAPGPAAATAAAAGSAEARPSPTYSLSRTCRPDRLGAPAAGLPSGLQSHAGGITYKSARGIDQARN